MKTARGIYHNIFDSDYDCVVGDFVFYFSSKNYRKKFLERLEGEVDRFNTNAKIMYKNQYNLDFTVLAMVRLYMSIEKRGFYITYKGETVTCLENLQFVLQIKTDNS